MKKRLLTLFVLAIVVMTAPAALANHCLRCKPLVEDCVGILNFGFLECYWDGSTCITSGPCGSHATAPAEPLAAEFTVASVERLDEPKTGEASQTLVASADVVAPQPATR